jgi:hypothetical protein
MNDLIGRFFVRDPIQYFSITDYIPAPDRGRQLPDAPPIPAAAPAAPELDFAPDESVVVETPVVEADRSLPAAERPIDLEE